MNLAERSARCEMTLLGWSLGGWGSLLGYLYGWVMICSFSLSPRLRCM